MSDSPPNPNPEGSGFVPPPTGGQPTTPPGGQPSGVPGGVPGGQPPTPPGQPGGQPGGWAPAPGYGAGYGPPPTGGVGQPADLLVRFAARLIDGILVGIVNAVIAAVVVAAILGLDGGAYSLGAGDNYAASAVNGVIGAVIGLGYFALMESRRGQTVGKMLLKLRTESQDGNLPTLEMAVKRNFWMALGALAVVPFLGVIGSLAELVIVIVIAVTISQSPIRQGWHDKLAGTRVIKIG